MPSPRPPSPLGTHHFPTHRAARRKAAEMPPRARQLVELMTMGTPDGSRPPMRLPEAAAFMGIKLDTGAQYFRHPAARAHYLKLVADLKAGELVANYRTAVEIRDDPDMKKSAAGNRQRIEAIRVLEGDHASASAPRSGDQNVRPGIVVVVNTVENPRVVQVDDAVIEVGPTAIAAPAEPAEPADDVVGTQAWWRSPERNPQV
jgi:hypothetical protein